ncbi:hypothetical protein [Sphingomonas sp. BK580]|uniref:hypothetical protein n=1 Tax=Sphingomonas sp. BK580 TaxID=2586972 RepID=UPI00160DD536|nr:hypothetical protein [Sphingomonas sp. BK580]MBB3692006.1 hypothetical protein [Sphingomonas sp. BK580]
MAKWVLASAFALLVESAASGQIQPTSEDVRNYLEGSTHRSYPEATTVAWERDLREHLAHATPAKAADAIAARYDIAPAVMRHFVAAWIVAKARQYGQSEAWKPSLRAELLSMAPALRRAPIGLAVLAEALDAIHDCSAADFTALLSGAQDRAADAYRIASAAACDDNFTRAALAAPDRAMPTLIRIAHWGGLPPRDALPLYSWLTSPAALSRVAAPDRMAVTVLLWQRYLEALLKAGLDVRALALFDGLSLEVRAAVLSPTYRLPERVVVDDIPMTFFHVGGTTALSASESLDVMADTLAALADDAATFAPEDRKVIKEAVAPPPMPQTDVLADEGATLAPILPLAMALAAAGRDAEARQLLSTLPGLAAAKAVASNLYSRSEGDQAPAPNTSRLPMNALILDQLLNNPAADPYPVAEVVLADGMGNDTHAGVIVRCRLFPAQDFPGLCEKGEPSTALDLDRTISSDAKVAASEAMLRRVIPDYDAFRTPLLMEAGPQSPSPPARAAPVSVVAPTSPFIERPIPSERRDRTTGISPIGLAPLPEGFSLVRAERVGQRAVAISVSQTLDPTGEISGGGYWVHLSADGGRQWAPPLYTGLAERFPYVVAPSSRLPLIEGDTLTIAVDVAEIDTATITYPPVGLRTRRRARNLYLTLPIAELRRDSDGDGWTDIASHHLLLDSRRGAGGTPFVVGSDLQSACTTTPSREQQARIGLLSKLLDPRGAAIVEPFDRPNNQIAIGTQRAAASASQPLFLLGLPEDYKCLRPTRPMIIYSSKDIEALKRGVPDFHAFELPSIVFNRAHDRGFVRWSTGWAGGTYRMRWLSGKWEYESISDWVT